MSKKSLVIIVSITVILLIALIGGSLINIEQGNTYIEQGAIAIDDVDGDISANIVIGGDIVDVNTPAIYTVTYNVTDSSGNAATQVIRSVNIIADTNANDTLLRISLIFDFIFL